MAPVLQTAIEPLRGTALWDLYKRPHPRFTQECSDLTPLIRKLTKMYGKLSICVSVSARYGAEPGTQHNNLLIMLRIMGRANRPRKTLCLAAIPLRAPVR